MNEDLVDQFAPFYGGDEDRAREDLEALYDAGIIDENGNMVSLDVREDGESVELSALAQRIASSEDVGAVTVNGNEAAPEQITQIQQVKSMLDVVKLIDADVEITDEHVANFEKLVAGIADGSIDLTDAISKGELQLNAKRSPQTLNGGTPGASPTGVPETATDTGSVDADDGKYTAPYISGSDYDPSHRFALSDPTNTAWYSESASDAVVTLAVDPDSVTTDDGGLLYVKDDAVTVTATLNKAQSAPVSFDWTAASDTLTLSGVTGGTITWAAGDTAAKTFAVTVSGAAQNAAAVGAQCFVVNAGNLKNAAFADGGTVWSQTVQRSAADKETLREGYPIVREVLTADLFAHDQGTEDLETSADTEPDSYRVYFLKTEDFFPTGGDFSAAAELNIFDGGQWSSCLVDVYVTGPDVELKAPITRALVAQEPYALFPEVQNYTQVFSMANISQDEGKQSLGEVIKDGEAWLTIFLYNPAWQGFYPTDRLKEFWLECQRPATVNTVVSASVPAGAYYSGQTVPVTVTLKDASIATADTTLTVNGVACPLLNTPGTESKQFTFGYTVKEVDTGAINVTALSDTLFNADETEVTLEGEFPATSIGADQNVSLISDVKGGSLDLENVKYGIDDAGPGEQTVTVLIPFKSGVARDWVANEAAEIIPVSLPLPGYPDATASYYLKSAYFSADGGATRYPVYVVGENADALAARFAPPMNRTADLRKDTVKLFLDMKVGAGTDYLGEWSGKQTDAKGFAYFTGSGNADAPAVSGAAWSCYVKGGVTFEPTETVSRPNYDAANLMLDEENNPLGFYKQDEEYVVLQDSANPDRQRDVELVMNEALYKAAKDGVRADEASALTLRYQISNRKAFTFTAPKDFTWSSSDETVAVVVKNEETGAGDVVLTGNGGTVVFTLTVGNGSENTAYELETPAVTVLEGKTPFLNIPQYSQLRTTLTDTDTDVLFASNVTARNAETGNETTTFTAKLYSVNAVNAAPTGEPIWTASFPSTIENTVTHVTVPGGQIRNPGVYAVVIQTSFEGGVIVDVPTAAVELSATAWLDVKQAPVRIRLNELESYSAGYDQIPAIGYTLSSATAGATVEYTVQKSGEALNGRQSVSGGTIPFSPGKPTELKDTYTITVYARNSEEDPWSVDSMLFRVYNTDLLDLIVADVAPGAIGGSTGGGESMNGKTVTMDNHGEKLNGYLNDSAYQLTYDDFTALRTDMSLQKMISVNYGTGVLPITPARSTVAWTTFPPACQTAS